MATVVKRPSGKWQATVRRDGRSSSKSFTKRADAVKWARTVEMQAESCGLGKRTQQPNTMTMTDALNKFAEDVSKQRSGTSGDVEFDR